MTSHETSVFTADLFVEGGPRNKSGLFLNRCGRKTIEILVSMVNVLRTTADQMIARMRYRDQGIGYRYFN